MQAPPERTWPWLVQMGYGGPADTPWRVLAVEPQPAIVYHSLRHPWRPHPFDPSDPVELMTAHQAP